MEKGLEYVLAKIEEVHSDTQEIKVLVANQNDRIRKLEIFRGWATGAASVVIFALSGALKYMHGLVK